MAENVIPFHDPSLPAEGLERLAARRKYRAGCKAIAASAVSRAFSETTKIPGTKKIGCEDALPVFVAAMRRELRKVYPHL